MSSITIMVRMVTIAPTLEAALVNRPMICARPPSTTFATCSDLMLETWRRMWNRVSRKFRLPPEPKRLSRSRGRARMKWSDWKTRG